MDETKSQDRETIPLQDLSEESVGGERGETVEGDDQAKGRVEHGDLQVGERHR